MEKENPTPARASPCQIHRLAKGSQKKLPRQRFHHSSCDSLRFSRFRRRMRRETIEGEILGAEKGVFEGRVGLGFADNEREAELRCIEPRWPAAATTPAVAGPAFGVESEGFGFRPLLVAVTLAVGRGLSWTGPSPNRRGLNFRTF